MSTASLILLFIASVTAALAGGVVAATALSWRNGDARADADHEDRPATEPEVALHARTIAEGLERMDRRLLEIERSRSSDHGEVHEALRHVSAANELTRLEASNLASALKDNRSRGVWGELQLRRVFELSGMSEHVDFELQVVSPVKDSALRPDAMVHLPGGRTIIVDAKAPLVGYLEASADDVNHSESDKRFATALATHVRTLSTRDYPASFEGAIDMVVLYLPGDCFLSAALHVRPALVEEAAQSGIVIATPSSMLMILRGASHAWKEQRWAEEATEISRMARQLHDRMGVYSSHLDDVGTHIGRTVEAYNRSVASFDTRLLPAVRQLESAGRAGSKKVVSLVPVSETPRDTRNTLVRAGAAAPAAHPSSPTSSSG